MAGCCLVVRIGCCWLVAWDTDIAGKQDFHFESTAIKKGAEDWLRWNTDCVPQLPASRVCCSMLWEGWALTIDQLSRHSITPVCNWSPTQSTPGVAAGTLAHEERTKGTNRGFKSKQKGLTAKSRIETGGGEFILSWPFSHFIARLLLFSGIRQIQVSVQSQYPTPPELVFYSVSIPGKGTFHEGRVVSNPCSRKRIRMHTLPIFFLLWRRCQPSSPLSTWYPPLHCLSVGQPCLFIPADMANPFLFHPRPVWRCFCVSFLHSTFASLH